jgi:hypothetical protein
MILLFDLDRKIGYYSKTFAGLTGVTGKCSNTLRNWIKEPERALKHGFMIVEGVKKTSNQGVNNSRF